MKVTISKVHLPTFLYIQKLHHRMIKLKDISNTLSNCFKNKPIVLIFRTRLLPISETFIRDQALSLTRYEPYFIGCKRVRKGIDLPNEKVFLLKNSLRLQMLLRPSSIDIENLQSLKPSLIHAHFGIDAVCALPIAQLLNVPLVVTFHGYDITLGNKHFYRGAGGGLFSRLYPLRRGKLFKSNSHFIAVSRFILKQAILLGCPEDRISLHYIGVNNNVFMPSTTPLSKRGNKVLFVGRLVEKKGCSYLLKAIQIIQQQIPDVELKIIGDGPLRNSLETTARNYNLKCTFLGEQKSNLIKEEMEISRVFCAPSIVASNGDAEGFGIVFLEAQATGLPIVSFASGGIAEAVEHGVTGYLAPERDVTELANYLLVLLKNDDIWQKMSSAGRQRVHVKFALSAQTAALEKGYDNIV
jgi:colanic acid/amylovoran biosynthesis glycosyltransferase